MKISRVIAMALMLMVVEVNLPRNAAVHQSQADTSAVTERCEDRIGYTTLKDP